MSHLVSCTLVSCLAVSALLLAGCGGGGGSGPAAAQNPDPVNISQLQVGTPICSTSGNGTLDGSTTTNPSINVTVTPSCSDPNARMIVALGVSSSDTNITHYDWEIAGWQASGPHGGLTKYNEVIDVDPVNGRFIVRTYDPNTRYATATSSQLATLTTPFTQQVTVTVWTADGRWGTANFNIVVQPGGTSVSVVNGSLAAADASSHGRAGHYADFYQIAGSGTTTLTAEGLDTYLYVYDSTGALIAEADEGANGSGSRLTVDLQVGQSYYVELTSYAPGQTGAYILSSSNGGLTGVRDPWTGATPPNIAGNFNVIEDTTITILYDGITTSTNATANTVATITQAGSSFSYQATDPSGAVPPVTRYGTINGNSVALTGQPFFPSNPDIAVTSNSQSSSGTIGNNTFTINTTAELQGSYNGKPLTAQMSSKATFTR